MQSITKLFTSHPASVNETYGQHFLFALNFSLTLFAALIHALLPFVFEKTASRLVVRLYGKTHNRGG